MKKILLSLITIISFSFLFGQEVQFSIVERNSQELVVRVSFPTADIQTINATGISYTKIYVGNAYPTLEAGAPEFLKSTFSIIIPEGSTPTTTILESDFEYETLPFELVPSKGRLYRNIDPATVPYIKGSSYQINDYLGDNQGIVSDSYQLRDFHGVNISVSPYAYNPMLQSLKIYHSILLKISFNQPFTQPIAKKNNREFNEIYKQHFLNFTPTKYTPIEEEGELLIIAPDIYTSQLEELKNWKIKCGIPTTIVPLSSTGNSSSNIKTYITNYYNSHNLAFVLTVGDNTLFPAYTTSGGWGASNTEDNYYAEVAGGDYYPDILLGKLSIENATHLTTQIQKILMYEQNTGETSHYPVACGIASEEGTGDDNEYDYEHIRNINQRLLNYTYTSQYEFYEGNHGGVDAAGDPSASSILNGINDGVGIVNYCGHGGDDMWVTSSFSNSNISQLTNYDKLPFIFSVACVNGDYVNNTCFAEAWLRATKNGRLTGAVATLMSTINQAWDPPMCGQDEMTKVLAEIYPNNIKRTFGGISFSGLMKVLDVYSDEETYRTWLVFGDPSLMVRTAIPQQLTATHNNIIPLGLTQITVNCPTDDAKFCLSANNEILDCQVTANGSVSLSIPNTIDVHDTLYLTGTKFNYTPYQAIITISSIEGPYPTVKNIYFTNAQGDTVNPEYGKNLTMHIAIQNIGNEVATNATLTTIYGDSYVQNGSYSFGPFTLSSFATTSFSAPFYIYDNVPFGYYTPINCNLSVDNLTLDSICNQRLYAPMPEIGNCIVNDSESIISANNSLDISENCTLEFEMKNDGDAASINGTVILTSVTGNIHINRPLNSIESINMNSSIPISFRVSVPDNIPANTIEQLNLTYYYGAYSINKDFYLPISQTVGINDSNVSGMTSVYPNPTSGKIRIENEQSIQKIELYNLPGQLIETISVNNTAITIDINNFASGVYIMKIIDSDNSIISLQKIVKR